MAGYITGTERKQGILFPESLDEYIDVENPVRLFDAFIDSLDMAECGFERAEPAGDGRPGYDPRDMLKLYVYGYFNGVRSSRKLDRECERNIEVMWLIKQLHPDFRTIADFRKDNKKALRTVFVKFNQLCDELGLYGREYVSIDGSKFKAVNNKDRNFTLSKLDDRMKKINENIKAYMAELDKSDDADGKKSGKQLNKEEIAAKIKQLKNRKKEYKGYQKQLEENGGQLSLTDPDSKLMKFKEGYEVGYNVQTAVDAKNHLIADFEVMSQPNDNGLLAEVAEKAKDALGIKTIEVVADKGYNKPENLVTCLENGIIPHVFPKEGHTDIELGTPYYVAEITKADKKSTEPEIITKCLHAGIIPDIYKGIITNIKVEGVTKYLVAGDVKLKETGLEGASAEEMKKKAREGYFIRDLQHNIVYCPAGEILRPNGMSRNTHRYCNKLACKNCKKKCTTYKYKFADFRGDKTIIANNAYGRGDLRYQKEYRDSRKRVKSIVKTVKFHLKVDWKKLNNRKCLSEHPFGTLKRAMGHSYMLLKGTEKVRGEMSLMLLAYNLKRAINACGVNALTVALS